MPNAMAHTTEQNDQWADRRHAASELLGDQPALAAMDAIGHSINEDREFLAHSIRRGQVDAAERTARRIRKLEHAYFRMGGPAEEYWPGCYR